MPAVEPATVCPGSSFRQLWFEKEALNSMHAIGLSVSYTGVHNCRNNLVKKQEEQIDNVVKGYKKKKCDDYEQKQSSSDVGSGIAENGHDSKEVENNVESVVSENRVEIAENTIESVVSENTIESVVSENTIESVVSENTIERVVSENKNESVVSGNIESEVTKNGHSCKLNVRPIEVLGDNLDITIAPAKMTMEKQRQSLHWFLTMVKQKRVTYNDLNMPLVHQPHISDVPSDEWIPSQDHMNAVAENFVSHISHILLKYVQFLEPVKRKSVILNCDLVDASEKSSQGMIEIPQKVHELAVPCINNQVLERVVFGGDVLTNERAFSAQEAMQNNKSEFDSLLVSSIDQKGCIENLTSY